MKESIIIRLTRVLNLRYLNHRSFCVVPPFFVTQLSFENLHIMLVQADLLDSTNLALLPADFVGMGSVNDAAKLSLQLKGKTLCIPSLWNIFHDWPTAVNPALDRLQQEIDGILGR